MSAQQHPHIKANEWRHPHPHGLFGLPTAFDADPGHIKAAALYRYRGMECEARLALQLGRVNHLANTIGSVFEGLGVLADYEAGIQPSNNDRTSRDRGLSLEGADAVGTAAKQIELVERVLERALVELRRAAALPSPADGGS